MLKFWCKIEGNEHEMWKYLKCETVKVLNMNNCNMKCEGKNFEKMIMIFNDILKV